MEHQTSTKIKCAGALLGTAVVSVAVLLLMEAPVPATLLAMAGCTITLLIALSDLPAKVVEEQRRDLRDPGPYSLGTRIDRATRHTIANVEATLTLRHRFPGVYMPSSLYSMIPANLAGVIELLDRQQPQTIVELGSGISTLYVASWLKARGTGRLITFDHDEHWAELCREHLVRLGLEQYAEIRVAPLREQQFPDGARAWYDLEGQAADLTAVDVLLVDGPPGGGNGVNTARLPALRAFHDKLSPNAVVFLDDGHRAGERKVVQSWTAAFPEFTAVNFNTATGYWLLTRASAAQHVPVED